MAHRFNVFSGLDRHINKKNKSIPVNHEPDNNRITPEQIKDIVSREVNAASTRSQMMNYFDSIAASSERTETMLVELRDALDAGLASVKNTKEIDIDESVKRIEVMRALARICIRIILLHTRICDRHLKKRKIRR